MSTDNKPELDNARIRAELVEIASWDCANNNRCTGMGMPTHCAPHAAQMILRGSWAGDLS